MPVLPIDASVQAKCDQVIAGLRAAVGAGGRLGVAFSGGVDSAVVLGLGVEALGADRVLALLGVSASLPASERAAAHELAAGLGVEVVEVATQELDADAYRANGADRCYHCKSELFGRIDDEVLTAHDLQAVAHGENADDLLRDDRPGAQAAVEHGVLRPLADAQLTKADVRAVARALQLPVADKPAAPCLASRIPHGEPVTVEKLAQIEAAEDALHALGFADVRVRHHGTMARIEVPTDELDALLAPQMRGQVIEQVKAAGFTTVAVDLAGMQSGAFTKALLGVPRVGR